MTGRYESANGRYSLHVNQAGHLVLGHWRHHGSPIGLTPSVATNAFEATVVSAEATKVSLEYSRSSEAGAIKGTMTALRQGDSVVLRLVEHPRGGRNVLLGTLFVEVTRTSEEPLIAPSALAGDQIGAAKASEQEAGLTPAEEQSILVLAQKLKVGVRRYVSAAAGIPRAAEAVNLDAMVRDDLKRAGAQHGIIVRRLQEHLSDEGCEQANTLIPVWDWLQIVISNHPEHTRSLQAFLKMAGSGFRDGAGVVIHKYRYKTILAGPEVKALAGFGLQTGVMIIEKLSPDQWRAGFSASQFQVSGGASVGVNLGGESSWSEFETPFPWDARNFVGDYQLVEGVKGLVGPIEASPEKSAIMTFYGDTVFPPLKVDGSGYVKVFGAGLGGSAAATMGKLKRFEEPVPIERRLTEPPRSVDETREYKATHSSYFGVNDPQLTDDGRAALRTLVARHRAALTNEKTEVLIEGYASPTGTQAHNMDLSYLRAAHVRQRIGELLGDELRAAVDLRAYGDEPAREAGVPATEEAPAWRVVHVSINGVVVLRL